MGKSLGGGSIELKAVGPEFLRLLPSPLLLLHLLLEAMRHNKFFC